MRTAAAGAVLSLLLALSACRGATTSGKDAGRSVPRGNAIWLADPAAAGDAGLEDRLQKLGAAALFLPAGEARLAGGGLEFLPDPQPPRPITRVPVVLVVRSGPAALASEGGVAAEVAGPALAKALAPALAASGGFGRVAGVHLDFPFSVASSERGAELVAAIKRALPGNVFVSISIRASPGSEEERKSLEPLAAEADALAAFVFGPEGRADSAAIDALRRPWWAVYGAAARGRRLPSGEPVSEAHLDTLSGDARVDFENDLSVDDAAVTGFHLTARAPVRLDGLTLAPGERVTFRLPALPEMIFQLGANLAGKRFVLGRILLFEGAVDADRVFPLAAFEDVLLGRSLAPVLEVSVQPAGNRAVIVEAVNRGPHASMVSRVSNWVEVDLAPGHAADVALGGFDRYEVYDASGRPVTPGRATRVRLYETLIAPGETISPASIVVRGGLPPGCCRHRLRLIAAAGPEAATDWTAPPPTPVPTKAPPTRRRKSARAAGRGRKAWPAAPRGRRRAPARPARSPAGTPRSRRRERSPEESRPGAGASGRDP